MDKKIDKRPAPIERLELIEPPSNNEGMVVAVLTVSVMMFSCICLIFLLFIYNQ